MTLLITPLNNSSNLPQLPTLPLHLPTTSNHSTAPSSATCGINFGTIFPSTNFNLLKKLLFSGLLQIELLTMKKFFLTRLRIGHTRLTHSFIYLGLFTPPSCQYCHHFELHFFSCLDLTNICQSYCFFSPLYSSIDQSRSHQKVPQLPLPFHQLLRLHLNPLFLFEPITLCVVARFVKEICIRKKKSKKFNSFQEIDETHIKDHFYWWEIFHCWKYVLSTLDLVFGKRFKITYSGMLLDVWIVFFSLQTVHTKNSKCFCP